MGNSLFHEKFKENYNSNFDYLKDSLKKSAPNNKISKNKIFNKILICCTSQSKNKKLVTVKNKI